MLENIVFGPFCCYKDDKHYKQIIQDISIENWLPLIIVKKGVIYDWLTSGIPLEAKKDIAGILITIGYLKTYEA